MFLPIYVSSMAYLDDLDIHCIVENFVDNSVVSNANSIGSFAA